MHTFSTVWCYQLGPILWVYNPPPSSPSFPSRHLLKTTPTTTPTPSGCLIAAPRRTAVAVADDLVGTTQSISPPRCEQPSSIPPGPVARALYSRRANGGQPRRGS